MFGGKGVEHRRRHPLSGFLNGPLVLRECFDLRHAIESPARDAIILPARLVMRVEADKDTNRVDAVGDRLTNKNRETCRRASIMNGSQRVLSGPDALMPQSRSPAVGFGFAMGTKKWQKLERIACDLPLIPEYLGVTGSNNVPVGGSHKKSSVRTVLALGSILGRCQRGANEHAGRRGGVT